MAGQPPAAGSAEAARAWEPGYDRRWEDYHRQMFTTPATNAFIEWKINSTGVTIARDLMAARNRAVATWEAEHSSERSTWPVSHPPTVLWMPNVTHGACLGCTWLRPGDAGAADAASAARQHSQEHLRAAVSPHGLLDAPLRVSPRNRPHDGTGPTWAR